MAPVLVPVLVLVLVLVHLVARMGLRWRLERHLVARTDRPYRARLLLLARTDLHQPALPRLEIDQAVKDPAVTPWYHTVGRQLVGSWSARKDHAATAALGERAQTMTQLPCHVPP